ncbi:MULTISPECIES: hypothetical protein [Streptomyces]|uniref:Uncharacterized protein n=2 Tax=Streptomyces TaxID=1883 RepID=A0ABV9IFX0_9ACTN
MRTRVAGSPVPYWARSTMSPFSARRAVKRPVTETQPEAATAVVSGTRPSPSWSAPLRPAAVPSSSPMKRRMSRSQ